MKRSRKWNAIADFLIYTPQKQVEEGGILELIICAECKTKGSIKLTNGDEIQGKRKLYCVHTPCMATQCQRKLREALCAVITLIDTSATRDYNFPSFSWNPLEESKRNTHAKPSLYSSPCQNCTSRRTVFFEKEKSQKQRKCVNKVLERLPEATGIGLTFLAKI